MRPSARSAVTPFAVMEILAAVAERRAAGEAVISLSAGEPSSGAPADVRALAAELLTGGAPLGYTASLGIPDLRAALAAHYARWYGVALPPERIAITTGSSGAFVLAFLAAFEPGDRVALARPGYPAYRNILSALGCEVVDLDAGAHERYQPTVELLEQAVRDGGPLRGLILASPANPTGTMVDAAELAALVGWCEASGTRLVSDEIYHGITFGDGPGTTAVEHSPEAIVVSSFSKYWGMTGWRLGWAVLPEGLVPAVDALAGNLALCPPALSQYAAVAAFTPASYAEAEAGVARYAEHRALLLDRLPGLGLGEIAPPDGAFYVYAHLGDALAATGAAGSVEWCGRLLAEAGVAVAPGTDFDAAGGKEWVRLSFAADGAVIREGLDRIAAWLGR